MIRSAFLLMSISFVVNSPVLANNLYLETFEDGNAIDGNPLHWDVIPGYAQGTFNIVDGDLVVTQTGGHSYIPFAAAPAPRDVSLRAALRTEDYMTIIARGNTTTGTSYGGGIRSDGTVHILRTHPGTGNGVSTFLASQPTDLRPAEENVFLQFDLVGTKLDVYAWRVGEAKPDTPSVSVTDSTHSNGGPFGFIKCCGTETSTIQSLQVASSPIGDLIGDFDASESLSASDVNLLSIAIGTQDAMFDLTGDQIVDVSDLHHWVTDIRSTWIGDATLDGEFNSTDLIEVFSAGKYDSDASTDWSEGDWNGDQRFDSGDLISAFQDGGYELGVRASAAAVPEPTNCLALALACLVFALRRGLSECR